MLAKSDYFSIFRFCTPVLNFVMNLTSRKYWNILKQFMDILNFWNLLNSCITDLTHFYTLNCLFFVVFRYYPLKKIGDPRTFSQQITGIDDEYSRHRLKIFFIGFWVLPNTCRRKYSLSIRGHVWYAVLKSILWKNQHDDPHLRCY